MTMALAHCTSYVSHCLLVTPGTTTSEAASSHAELNKQIPPVERADNLPSSLLNTGLHESHWYVISRKVALSQVKSTYSSH